MRRLILMTAALFTTLVSSMLAAPPTRQQSKRRPKKNYKGAITTEEKLKALINLKMTSAEISLATGCSVRAIEARRRRLNVENEPQKRYQKGHQRISKTDAGIDALYSLASMLETRYKVPPHNVRAWFIGRSAYLGEQRPAILLGSGEFELVRDAAIAYATSESPEEFLDRVGTVTRVADSLGA